MMRIPTEIQFALIGLSILFATGCGSEQPNASVCRSTPIVAVSTNGRLFELNVGYDNGVREGDEVQVSRRSGTYVGSAVVRRTKPDRCVAEDTSLLSTAGFMAGDEAVVPIGPSSFTLPPRCGHRSPMVAPAASTSNPPSIWSMLGWQ